MHGFTRPDLVDEAGVAPVFNEAMERSADLYAALQPEFPTAASYAVSMAYRVRYSMQFNAREAMHMLELRTAPQGHPSYRRVCLEMHRLIADQAGHRAIAAAMTHVNSEDPGLERLQAERQAEKRRTLTADS
jgi:thymidylate synthase ThyX